LYATAGVGEKRRYTFPAGAFDFISANAEDSAVFDVLALFPVLILLIRRRRGRSPRLRAALFDPANAETAEAGPTLSPGTARGRRRTAKDRATRGKPRSSAVASRSPARPFRLTSRIDAAR
jgi:hypothetical protein